MYYEVYLPFPPTINNYYKKSSSGGRYISQKGKKFRQEVAEAINGQLPDVNIDYKVLVECVLFPPDNRVRDLDNYNKPLLDAITEGNLWGDDFQVDQLFNYRGETRSRQGSCYVRISEAGPIISNIEQLPLD